MRILHLTTHLNIGGISRYVTTLAKALKDRGHTVFIASSGGELEKYLSEEGIRHIYLDIKTKSELSPGIIRSYSALRNFFKEEKIDLLHAHTRVTQVLAALLSFSQKIPYVTTCHGFFKKRLGRCIFGCWGRRVVAISEAVKRQLIEDFGVDGERISLIHTGIETAIFTESAVQEEKSAIKRKWNLNESVVIGTIGRLSPVKGQEVLIKAAKKLVNDFLDIKILLVGSGPDEKRLRSLTSALGLDEDIIFIPSVDNTRNVLSVMDVFVLPSIEEGLGLSLIEAMASGTPCVASRVGGIESLIEDGVTGLLFKPGDADDLARAVSSLLCDRNKAEAFKGEARKRVVSNFNIDKMARGVEELYREVVKG